MKFKLITLSPIHIGSGDQISNWSYAVNNGKIKIYNFEKVVKAFKDNPQRLMNLTATIERNPLTKNLGEVLQSYGIDISPEYEVEFKGKIKKQFWNKKQNLNIVEYKHIWEFIKENGKVYIPGTEIKGAIRTALFYKILKDKFLENEKIKNQFLEEYKNCLNVKYFKNKSDKKKKIQNNFKQMSSRWENFVFRGDFNENDAKKDIMKILYVSDTSSKLPQESLEIKDVIGINIQSREVRELHELIKPNTELKLDITISPYARKAFLYVKQSEELANLPKKYISACKEFSKDLLIEEYNYFKENKFNEEFVNKEKILIDISKLYAKIKKEEKVILRLGKHQGFLSTTINLLVKKFAPELYSEAYEYLVPKGYSDHLNKSRKLTIDNELLGWCVLTQES